MTPEAVAAPAAFRGTERQQDILRRAVASRVLRVRDLAAEYGVHEMTVRRDLDALCEQGLLERVHGGARLASRTGEELSHQLRAAQNVDAKARIARAALDLIHDGDTVALDASTTSLALAKLLPARRVQAIACGLDAAEALSSGGVPFFMVGGNFHAPARSFVGGLFMDTMGRLHPDKVFFSAKGFTPETGFTDPHLPEVGAKQALIRSAASAYALVDHSKFGRRALATIASAEQVEALITDAPPPDGYRAALEGADVRLLLAPGGRA